MQTSSQPLDPEYKRRETTTSSVRSNTRKLRAKEILSSGYYFGKALHREFNAVLKWHDLKLYPLIYMPD
jgi:hypothetical protein